VGIGVGREGDLESVPHLSLRGDRGVVLDEVDALLLLTIAETSSLTRAAKRLGISYRNAWGRIKRIESMRGKEVLESTSGGAEGGSSKLTQEGEALVKEYRKIASYISRVLDDQESAANVGYKLSARNRIRARVTKVEKGDVVSIVKLASVETVRLTSIISNEAVDDLGLTEGNEVDAIIKSTEVMVAKPAQPRPAVKPRKRGR